MNKTYLFSADTLKTIFQGALGAISFGIYFHFTTNKMIELNNQKIYLLHKSFMDKQQNQIDDLKILIYKLNNNN
jgi:hypothetical protein